MSSLWLNNGGLVMAGGQLCLDTVCPCDTGTGTGSETSCDACEDGLMNGEMEVTISGTVNGTFGCTQCPDHDGVFALPLDPDAGTTCQWFEYWEDLIGSGNGCHSSATDKLVVWAHYDSGADSNWFTCESTSPGFTYRYPETGELPGKADCLNFDETFYRTSTNVPTGCQWPDTIRVRTR